MLHQGKRGRRLRQFAALAAVALAAGCSAKAPSDQVTPVGPALGGVVADEPRAALVGRDILAAGGTAADAAAAMYFAMAVTLPSRASLGGGGVCLVFEPKTRQAQAVEFLARSPQRIPAGADRPSAVPGSVRGFYSLQARYGRLRWSQVLVAAENLARFGATVSRAFADDIRQVAPALATHPAARQALTARGTGRLVGEGDVLVQDDLASVLARVRTEGPGDFYGGVTARKLVRGVREAGGSLDASDLERYEPVWRPAIDVEGAGLEAHFPSPPPPAGAVAAQIWAMLVDHDRYVDASSSERAHLLAEATVRALAAKGRWQEELASGSRKAQDLVDRKTISALMSGYDRNRRTTAEELGVAGEPAPENPAAASFIAVDVTGLAVACEVTANNLFGTGRIAPGTGVVLASAPGPGGRGATALGPMLVSDGRQFVFAAAASGGQAAPTAMVATAARVLLAETPLGEALSKKRIHRSVRPDLLLAESGVDPKLVRNLSERGYTLAFTPTLGHVVAAYCPDGSPDDPASCSYAADPRGYGLAARAE